MNANTHILTRDAAPTLDVAKAAKVLVDTQPDRAASLARIALGAMILPHGMQKMFGILGGYGFDATMGYFTETLGIPWFLAVLAIVAEFFGGLGLLAGLLGRVAAFGVGVTMAAAALTHLGNGFFMNWGGSMPAGAEGWEFHLLAVGLAAVVLIRGSGAWSLDRALFR